MSRATPDHIPSVAACVRFGIEMPSLLVRMEEELGEGPVRAFLAEWAGIDYAITVLPRTGCRHPEVTDWLRQAIGFGKYAVPMGPAAARVRQVHAVCRRLVAGASLASIARECRVPVRTITRHKARLTRLGLLPPKDLPC